MGNTQNKAGKQLNLWLSPQPQAYIKVPYFIHETFYIIPSYLRAMQMNEMPRKIVKILSYFALGVQIDKGTFRTLG